jgi:3-dehydroquinate synthase
MLRGIVKTITIQLDSHSYDIAIGEGLLPGVGAACKAVGLGGTAAVITNPTVAPLYAVVVTGSLQEAGFSPVVIEIPDGEEYKTAATLQTVYDRLIEAGLDRRSFIVALGGGVVGDLAGFAAATFLRGIPFVQLPTTLLAQVDSSVGGKTGIDHPLGKNLIGAFYQPHLVLSDVSTLNTLSERHYRAGLAEVVKYGVVFDVDLFALLEAEVDGLLQRNPALLGRVVARCCEIKAWVVEQDEREAGLRAVLNYGHTLGHAFETLSGYRDLVHGEAVAIGMVQAALLSQREGYCSVQDVERISTLLQRLGLPTAAPDVDREDLISALAKDKKNRSGTLQYICNKGIGSYILHLFTPAQLAEACYSGR